MGERLGHVPVLLATRRAQQALGQGAQDRFEGVAEYLLLCQDAGCLSLVDARSQLAAQGLEPGEGRAEGVPAGDDVGRIGLDG
ncbi:MAG: hypothetical protein ACRDGD_02945 [Candidatus Limnocylindria bacterium]